MERKDQDRIVRPLRATRSVDRVVEVDLPQYENLLISRRRLQRVPNRLLWLRDLDTDEVFVSAEASSARLSERS